MPTSASALQAQLDLHTRLFNNALAQVTDEDANTRNSETINHIKWVAGHLLNTRVTTMSKLAGLQPDDTYAAQFGRGVALNPSAAYPPLEEISAKWNETAAAISTAMMQLPEEVLASPAPARSPIADETFRGLLAFLVSHEAYHIGQLSLLRKMVGKEAMSYN